MDVDDAAAREDLVEFIALQLVVAGAARHDHGLDVEVVQRIGHAMEQHPVVGDDLLGLVVLAVAALRIAAAQVTRRQHGLHPDMPQHGLRGQADLREQPLRAAAREVEHGLGIGAGGLRVADDRHDLVVFDIEQRARGFLGQVARHFLVDEVDHLLAHRRLAMGGRRRLGLLFREFLQDVVAQALRLVAPADHHLPGGIDGGRVGRVQEEHRGGGAGLEGLLVHLAQQVAHVHRHIAEVDIDRAGRHALVADRAMVGHVLEFFPVPDRDAAPGLLFIQEGFDQQRGREDLVARRIQAGWRAAHGWRTPACICRSAGNP